MKVLHLEGNQIGVAGAQALATEAKSLSVHLYLRAGQSRFTQGGQTSQPARTSVAARRFDARTRVDAAFLNKVKSVGHQYKGIQYRRFDEALKAEDFDGFVKLLSSKEPIKPPNERMHAWAADPKTVGAFAATRLAVYAGQSGKDEKRSRLKDDIRQAGAIPVFVDWLKSDEVDRVQWALIALSLLTDDNKENIAVACQAGALELLLKVICSEVAGERVAANRILRNIGLEDDVCRQELVKLGGIRAFVNHLDTSPDPALNHAAVQNEAILNLQDMIETEDEDTIPEYATE